jgi:hypothetical protein
MMIRPPAPAKKRIDQMTRKELLAAPWRDWKRTTDYDSLLVLPSRTKHGSGFRNITIIGVKGDDIEIVTQNSDDLNWFTPPPDHPQVAQLRTDCFFKSGALHFWSRRHIFRVGAVLSSIDITLVLKP